MKLYRIIMIASTIFLSSNLLTGCMGQKKIERCKFVEIEDAEFEVEFGDVDVEGGEVEMVCGDKIVDVSWNQFKRKLRIDPQKYINNLEAFKGEVNCIINEGTKDRVIFCSRPRLNDEFVALKFNYDD